MSVVLCRVCLADGIKVHRITDTKLQEIFEKLSNSKLTTKDGRSRSVCYMCCAQLQRVARLIENAQRSEDIVTELFEQGIALTQQSVAVLNREMRRDFSITPVQRMQSTDLSQEDVEVKVERITFETHDSYDNEDITNCVCRICLIGDVRTKAIVNTKIQDMYERLTSYKLLSRDRPVAACCVCLAQLQTCVKLAATAQRSDKLLATLFSNGIQLTPEMVRVLNARVEPRLARFTPGTHDDTHKQETPFNDTLKKNVTILGTKPHKSTQDLNAKHSGNNKTSNVVKDRSYGGKIKICKSVRVVVQRLPKNTLEEYIKKRRKSSDDLPNIVSIKKENNTSDVSSDEPSNNEQCTKKEDTCKYPLRNFSVHLEKISIDKLQSYLKNTEDKKTFKIQFNSKVCKICSKEFKTVSEMFRHRKREHTQLQCKKCNITFKNESILKLHTLTPCKVHKCGYCNNKYVYSRSLKIHLKCEHSIEFNCDLCSRSYASPSALRDHLFTHTGQSDVYICDVCNKKFLRKNHLKQHMLHHFGPKYECDHCGKKYTKKSGLGYHLASHYGRPFTCDICNKSFGIKSILKSHLQTHSNVKHECKVCGKILSLAGTLRGHMHLHKKGREKRYACDICDSKFYSKAGLELHLMIHSGVKPFTCEVCQKGFKTKSSLKSHMNVHIVDPERKYVCDVCNKGFTRKSYLNQHYKTHFEAHPCPTCGKTFRAKRNLKIHIRMHTGEKPYACPLCDKAFIQNSQLSVHVRSHTQTKLHACDLCDKKFCEKRSLHAHKTNHKQNQQLICDLCYRVFIQKDKLVTHMKVHRKGENNCFICNKPHDTLRDMTKHMRVHKKKHCSFCGKKYTTNAACNRHTLTKHGGAKKYGCNRCEIMFQGVKLLYHHVRTHTKEKPHKCGYCEKTYNKRHQKLSHELLHTGMTQPFVCKICGQGFNRKYVFNNHLLLHEKGQHPCDLCDKVFYSKFTLTKHSNAAHGESD